MKWRKKGLIFRTDKDYPWMVSHASIPVPDLVSENKIRIYFGARDEKGRSLPGFIDVKGDNPSEILHICDRPILDLGEIGTFDDNGIMPSWIVNHSSQKWLYYIGWNPQVTVSYRLSIGLALIDHDTGLCTKYSKGPILDRTADDAFFSTTPCVLYERGAWKMWYTSCTGWQIINSRPEPFYRVHYAESEDGINWRRTSKACIDYDDFAQAIARPCVFVRDGLYRMIYSYRHTHGYRTDPKRSYRLGYAESTDGIEWKRRDGLVGIDRSSEGWDSIMIEYASVMSIGEKSYLFYNGNGFGESGIGYAELEEW